MAIVKKAPLLQSLLLISAAALIGCGGGGGSTPPASSAPQSSSLTGVSSSSPVGSSSITTSSSIATSSSVAPSDTTPNAFTLSGVTNVQPGTAVVSPAVEITGIDAASTISIAGGEYAINGGDFTSVDGTINNGQTIAIRTIASDKTNTPVDVTVTVGGVSATFTVTTLADVTPDAFEFTAKTEAEFETDYTSNSITVNGIDVAVPITIAGGEYSVDSGAYTSAASTVSAGQTVVVKTKSGASTEITSDAVLTIGGVTGTFTVTTPLDTAAPIAEFKFPTPYTMSEANEVKVRGVATDDHVITEVKLVVRSFNIDTPDSTLPPKEVIAIPKSEIDGVKDFSSWTASISLIADAENEIKVVAVDDRGNETVVEQANKVVIRQAPIASAFPDEVNPISRFQTNLLIDNYDNRNRMLFVNSSEILSVDLTTGERDVFFLESCNLMSWAIDRLTKRIFGMCSGSSLKEYDLKSGEHVATHALDDSLQDYSTFSGMIIDREDNRAQLLMVEAPGENLNNNGRMTTLSLTDKTVSVLVPADASSSMHQASDVVIDDGRYLISGGNVEEFFGNEIVGVNALTGEQSVVSNNLIGSGDVYGKSDVKTYFTTVIKSYSNNKLFLSESYTNRIFMLDLDNYKRTIIGDISYINGEYSVSVHGVDLEIDEQSNILFLADNGRKALLVIDAETGDRVILSKSKNLF